MRDLLPQHRRMNEWSISELMVGHMLDALDPAEVRDAKDVFARRVVAGEADIRQLYYYCGERFLRNHAPRLEAFTTQYDYLQFLYKERPASLEQRLNQLEGFDAAMIQKYHTLCKRFPTKDEQPFIDWLKSQQLFLEAAWSARPTQGRQAALLLTRRKTTDRAIRKIAHRLIKIQMYRHNQGYNTTGKEPDRPLIDDWFGLKVVTYTEQQAHAVYNLAYANLGRIGSGFRPASHQLQVIDSLTGRAQMQRQPPGVDNHYSSGTGYDSIIQVKVIPANAPGFLYRELGFTDVLNMLLDEMQHTVEFEAKRRSKEHDLLHSRQYRSMHREFFERGHELAEYAPDVRESTAQVHGKKQVVREIIRRKILVPTETF